MASLDAVYGAFLDYYGDINLGFFKSENGWVIYGAKVHSGLNENRYIFVVVEADKAAGMETTLDALDWVSFQTRTTSEIHNLPVHHIYLNEERKKMFSDQISMIERTKDHTHYVTTYLPIKIRLVHDPKKNNYLQYPDKALMYQALETYRCVVDTL